MNKMLMAFAISSMLVLSGCGRGSRQDIIKKGESAKTKADLEKALGKPDSQGGGGVSVGGLSLSAETWTYKASDGDVVYLVANDKVTLQVSAGGGGK